MNAHNVDVQQLSPEVLERRCSLEAQLNGPDLRESLDAMLELFALADPLRGGPDFLPHDAVRAKVLNPCSAWMIVDMPKLRMSIGEHFAHIVSEARKDKNPDVREAADLFHIPGDDERLVAELGDGDLEERCFTLRRLRFSEVCTTHASPIANAAVAILVEYESCEFNFKMYKQGPENCIDAAHMLEMLPLPALAPHHKTLADILHKLADIPRKLALLDKRNLRTFGDMDQAENNCKLVTLNYTRFWFRSARLNRDGENFCRKVGRLVGRVAWYRCKTKLLLQQITEPWAVRAWAPGKRTHAMMCRAHEAWDEDVREQAIKCRVK